MNVNVLIVELLVPHTSAQGFRFINIIRCHKIWFFWEHHGKKVRRTGEIRRHCLQTKTHKRRHRLLCGGYLALTTCCANVFYHDIL